VKSARLLGASAATPPQPNDSQPSGTRIQLLERCLILLLRCHGGPDSVAIAANRLFASNGTHRILAMATEAGLSPRQFERRFLAQVGVPPKLYARIIRFNAALDHKLRYPSRAWSRIATDQDYYDQMHLVHDCRAFTGESPSRFLARLDGLPAFHTLFATDNRPRTSGRPAGVASLLSGHAAVPYHP